MTTVMPLVEAPPRPDTPTGSAVGRDHGGDAERFGTMVHEALTSIDREPMSRDHVAPHRDSGVDDGATERDAAGDVTESAASAAGAAAVASVAKAAPRTPRDAPTGEATSPVGAAPGAVAASDETHVAIGSIDAGNADGAGADLPGIAPGTVDVAPGTPDTPATSRPATPAAAAGVTTAMTGSTVADGMTNAAGSIAAGAVEVLTVPNGSQPDAHAAELVTAPQPQSPNGVASDVPAPSAPGDATDRATIVDDAHVDDTTLQDRPGPRDAAGSQLNLIAERRPAGAPSAAATRADAPVPHAASDPTVTDPREPWEQVAKAMHGVRRDADGSHRVTVRLDPPELGTVEIEVHVHGGRLSVHATADSFATRDLLARALPQLRASLEAGGFETGSLEVGARSAGDGSGRGGDAAPTRPTGRAVTGRAARDTATIPAATTAAADSPNRLDLRL